MTSYGNPASGAVSDPRPRCWGLSFDNEHPECRKCSYQTSCRDQVIRTAQQRQAYVPAMQQQLPATVTPTSYFSQFQQPNTQQYALQPATPLYQAPTVPYQVPPPMYTPATPVPVVRQPAPVPVSVAAPRAPQPQPVVAQNWQLPQGWPTEVYGRVQDPMFMTITTAPSPLRPQFEGESFGERAMKNMALAAGEAVLGQALLFMRQLFWFPRAPQEPVEE